MLPVILSDQGAFLQALESAGAKVKGKVCTCPFHDDNTPSAQWSQGSDGTWRMYCHVCNRYANVLDLQAHTSGGSVKEMFKAAAPEKRVAPKAQPIGDKMAVKRYAERIGVVESWHVYGPKDAPAMVVARIRLDNGKKTFRQFTCVDGRWYPQNLVERGKIPLYRSDSFGPRVLVVEGEKCADAVAKLGISATTSAMGAGKAAESDWSSLAGRDVFLWPDNDDTGRKHMTDVKAILEGLGAKVYLINPDGMGLPAKGDVADLIDGLDGKTAEEIAMTINGIMDDAQPCGASNELAGLFEDIKADKFQAIPWFTLEVIGTLSKALLPGSITTLCADPGAGKSLLMLQMLAAWHKNHISVALLALEDERRMHLQRILAQAANLADLTDDTWVKSNPEQAHNLLGCHRDFIDTIGGRIKAEGEDQMKLSEIGDWVEARAKAGCRIIVVDPVTAATTEREPWAADTAFLMRVKKIAREHGASVILVTHPRGMQKGASLSGMAGGSAYPRFSHCALWLEKFDMQEREAADGALTMVNRTIRITKARNGKGGGQTIGLVFDADTLRFRSAMPMAPEKKRVISNTPQSDTPPPTKRKTHSATPTADEDLLRNI